MPSGWMHVVGDHDPLIDQVWQQLPAELTDEQRSWNLEQVGADENLLERMVSITKQPLLDQVPDVGVYVDTRRIQFRRRLRWAWSTPFDLYLATHRYIEQLGEEFNDTYRAESELPEPLLEAMTRNLARACLTSNEVFSLLEAGHRHGALARARTLHELDVVSLTLALHPELAEPYLLHHHIERYKFVKAQHEVNVAHGLDRVPADELDALRSKADGLVERFGTAYKQSWGWAAPILDAGKNGFGPLFKKVTSEQVNP